MKYIKTICFAIITICFVIATVATVFVGVIYCWDVLERRAYFKEYEEKRLEEELEYCLDECDYDLSFCVTSPTEDFIAFEDVPCWLEERECKAECSEKYSN